MRDKISSSPVLSVVSKILFAPIIIFGLYVQFHGDYGPGGGFQAGVIVAAAFILYSMIFGLSKGDYNVLSSDPSTGQHIGIILVELGVGITVATVMIALYHSFASFGEINE